MYQTSRRLWAVLALGVGVMSLGGCNVVGFVAQGVAGDPPPINVTAEYYGLENQSVAVLVNADLPVIYAYPQAQLEVADALARKITANVAGARVIDARQSYEFQVRNYHWTNERYSVLADKLNVSRLVVVELLEYRTRERGNAAVYQGVIIARVDVVEADGGRPDDVAYSGTVEVQYPPGGKPIPVPSAQEVTIRKGMLDMFALAAGGKFYDHKQPRGG